MVDSFDHFGVVVGLCSEGLLGVASEGRFASRVLVQVQGYSVVLLLVQELQRDSGWALWVELELFLFVMLVGLGGRSSIGCFALFVVFVYFRAGVVVVEVVGSGKEVLGSVVGVSLWLPNAVINLCYLSLAENYQILL